MPAATLSFSAYDLHERALAWIVEERLLRAALLQRVFDAGVTVIGGTPFVGLEWTADEGTLTLGKPGDPPRTLAARLVVGADGVRSWVREAAGIVAEPKPYGQTAVVANFACRKAHQGIARQWFRSDGGVLAWLPLPGRRISIVWSAPDALAEELAALGPEALAARVADAGGGALGELRPDIRLRRLCAVVAEAPRHDRAPAGARRRRRAWRPSARRPRGQPGLWRRAGAGASRGRARAGRGSREPRCSWNASPAAGSNRSLPCRR